MSWHTARLSDVCHFENGDRGKNYPGKSALLDDGIPFVNAGDLQEGVVRLDGLSFIASSHYEKLSNGRFSQGDFLFCLRGSLGKFAYVDRAIKGAIASSLIIIRPQDGLHPDYLKHYLGSGLCEKEIVLHANGAAQPNLAASSLKQFKIPLPPLNEQRRIAAILDKADQLRQKRRQAIALLDSLTQSIFLEMFGDPVSNPKSLKRLDLISVARFTSGATPSKGVPEFWEGSIPWVSPKDMKVNEIYDAEDHVSVSALQQTNLKSIEPNTTLIVVRGMILAHTVPLAVTKLPVTINQDMKAVVFGSDIHPMVGFWNLKVQADYILSQISTAAHGTKKLDMEILEKLPILVPTSETQMAFVAASAKVVETVKHYLNSSRDLDVNFASLQHRAFAGQL